MTLRNGQILKLIRDTPAIDNSGGKPTAITVPTGAIICATGVRKPDNPQMIEVQWQECRVFMFAIDVQERGEKLMDAGE